jgi:hypothetical protein
VGWWQDDVDVERWLDGPGSGRHLMDGELSFDDADARLEMGATLNLLRSCPLVAVAHWAAPCTMGCSACEAVRGCNHAYLECWGQLRGSG